MAKVKWVVILLVCILFITGCWDSERLRDMTLIYGVGFERSDKGGIQETFVIQEVRNATQGGGEKLTESITSEGDMVYDTALHADLKESGMLEIRNLQLMVVSKELARQDLFKLLEPFLRNRGTPMTMKIVMAEGGVRELLQKKKIGKDQTVEHIIKLVDNAENMRYFPKNNLKRVNTLMMDSGKDFGLPVIKREEDRIKLAEYALFNGSKFSGVSLSIPESSLLTLLKGEQGDKGILIEKIGKNKLALGVRHLSNHMDISREKNDKVAVHVSVNIKTAFLEGRKSLPDKERKELEVLLSKKYTNHAEALVKKIQRANCDLLGIGRELNAYDHQVWEKMNWNKQYPHIKIEPKVKLEIINSGVRN